MRISMESKVRDILTHYPQIKQMVDPYLSFFYRERLDGILFKRLSLHGALKLANIPEEEKENLIQAINKILNKS